MNKIIYLDNAATTATDPIVLEAYNKAHQDYFANPSSINRLGQIASRELDKTKEAVLRFFNLNNHQVIYLSGATEANNLAIKGACLRYQNRGKHIITSNYEHPSVLEAFKQLEEKFGFNVTYLNPDKDGHITVDAVKSAIKDDTVFVSLMAVNNEIGAINPIEDIAILLEKYPKIIFHVDAAQAIGKANINYSKVDLLTISAHKIHGLVGFGALIKKKNIDLLPLNNGGGQEYGLRSGTSDLPGAIAFSKALELTMSNQKSRHEHVLALANMIYEYLDKHNDLYEINSNRNDSPYIINFSTLTKKGSVVVEALSNYGVMVSSTSACHSSKEKGSYVVKSIGKSDAISRNTVRVSLDYTNTKEEILDFLSYLDKIMGEIR